ATRRTGTIIRGFVRLMVLCLLDRRNVSGMSSWPIIAGGGAGVVGRHRRPPGPGPEPIASRARRRLDKAATAGRGCRLPMAGSPPLYAALPFVAMLLVIALCPLAVPHWWEPNRHKLLVAAALGLPVAGLYLVREPAALLRMGEDYGSFIVLLAGLYVIAGGIRLTGDLEATPATTTTVLAVVSGLASFLGTTGASMLLIGPLLQTNRELTRVRHTVVFFVFLVSNVGGLLTPLGDPPLFLGYLQGVPFSWTLRLWPAWLIA